MESGKILFTTVKFVQNFSVVIKQSRNSTFIQVNLKSCYNNNNNNKDFIYIG